MYHNLRGKIVRLCQIIGTSPDKKTQRIKGTNKFYAIDHDEIPKDHRKEITYSKVVCMLRPKNKTPIALESQLEVTASNTQATWELKMHQFIYSNS